MIDGTDEQELSTTYNLPRPHNALWAHDPRCSGIRDRFSRRRGSAPLPPPPRESPAPTAEY